jgi:hypothetical protein
MSQPLPGALPGGGDVTTQLPDSGDVVAKRPLSGDVTTQLPGSGDGTIQNPAAGGLPADGVTAPAVCYAICNESPVSNCRLSLT